MRSNYLDDFINEEEYTIIYDIINTFKIEKEFNTSHVLKHEAITLLQKYLNVVEFALIKNWKNKHDLDFSNM